jgi:hypothetical protein
MRNIVRSLALTLTVVVLSSSLPASAAEPHRKDGSRDRATPIMIVKRIIRKIIGITTLEDLGGPKPAPTQNTEP